MKLIPAEFLPMKTLPQDRSLTEGLGEIFTLPLRDRPRLRHTDQPLAAPTEL